MEQLQDIEIGSLEVVLDHPLLHRLPPAVERRIISEYQAHFERAIDTLAQARGFPVTTSLVVVHVGSGCIRAKLKCVLKVAAWIVGSVAVLVAKYPEYRGMLHAAAKMAAAEYGCKLADQRIVCKAVLTTVALTEAFYYTQDGDRLTEVVRRVWHVPAAREKQYLRAVMQQHPDAWRFQA